MAKKVKLWGGIADGTEVDITDQMAREGRPIIWATQPPLTLPRTRDRDRSSSVWASEIGGRIETRYEHSLIAGRFEHPCMKGLVMECKWNFWSTDLKGSPGTVSLITHGQRPDEVELRVTDDCPWVR